MVKFEYTPAYLSEDEVGQDTKGIVKGGFACCTIDTREVMEVLGFLPGPVSPIVYCRTATPGRGNAGVGVYANTVAFMRPVEVEFN